MFEFMISFQMGRPRMINPTYVTAFLSYSDFFNHSNTDNAILKCPKTRRIWEAHPAVRLPSEYPLYTY